MDPDTMSEYERIGRFLASLLESELPKIEPGDSLLDIAERIEAKIKEAGYEPAFPVNLSVNEVAAHYTPPPEDSTLVPEGALLKVDVGVRSGGLIVDAARTVDLSGKYETLIAATREAVEAAKRVMAPGVPVAKVSAAIYEAIRNRGLKPITNLAGHKIEPYRLHAGIDIPNVPSRLARYKFSPGDVFAVEPFVTTPEGAGYVGEAPPGYIFSFLKNVRPSDYAERKILEAARERFRKLPFCERWIVPLLGIRVEYAIRRLVKRRALREYAPLVEAKFTPVAQWENTLVVTDSGATSLTG